MRLDNILKYAALAVVLTVSQSCLKDQRDLFDETASARMQAFLENARTVLTGAEYGWRMEYFTDYGGFNYALKFVNGQVVASSEMKPGITETSYFKLATDDGPVLSFDTHSEILHFFATPSSSEYQGKGGDFEFIILSAEPDTVVLKGERTGNIARLYPLSEPLADFTAKIAEIIKNTLVLGFDCEFPGSDNSWSGRFDLTDRSVIFGQYDNDGIVKGEEISEKFIYTETGVKLYEPLTAGGQNFNTFDFGEIPGEIRTDNNDVKITARAIPDDYLPFECIPGTYSLSAGGKTYTVDVTVEDEFARSLEISGTDNSFNYQFYMYYDVNTGHLDMDAQYIHVGEEICPNDDFYVTLIGCDSKGSLTLSYSMKGVWNGASTEKPVFNFVSGTETADVIGFLLWNYSGSEGFGKQYEGSDYVPKELYPITSMRKIR